MDLKQLILLALCCSETVYAHFPLISCRYNPVCGNDGITYENDCTFQEAKLYDKDLEILFEDQCEKYKMITSFGVRKIKKTPKTTRGEERPYVVLFHEGPLHGIVNQEAEPVPNMKLKGEFPQISNSLLPNLDGHELGWSSISRNKLNRRLKFSPDIREMPAESSLCVRWKHLRDDV